MRCKKPATDGKLCSEHAEKNREASRQRSRVAADKTARRNAGTVTAEEAAAALGIRSERVHELAREGLVPFDTQGVKGGWRRFRIEEIRDAIGKLNVISGVIYRPGSKRGAAVLARREQRAAGVLICSRCGARIDHLPSSWLKRSAFWCSDCRAPSKRATDIRRRRMRSATQVEPVDTRRVAERDGWKCAICGAGVTRDTWSLDHVIPLSKGGPHTYSNVVLAHRDCNSKRGAGRFPVAPPVTRCEP